MGLISYILSFRMLIWYGLLFIIIIILLNYIRIFSGTFNELPGLFYKLKMSHWFDYLYLVRKKTIGIFSDCVFTVSFLSS